MKIFTVDEQAQTIKPADAEGGAYFESEINGWARLVSSDHTRFSAPTLVPTRWGLDWRRVERLSFERRYGIGYENTVCWCQFFKPEEFQRFVVSNNAQIVCIEPFMDVFKYVLRFPK